VGIDVHRAARVMGAAQGGQIVASEAFAAAIGDELPSDATLRPLGSFQLRGFSEEERLYLVTAP
jgi:class 3 adenylate cyclase